jgi:hypothetical protein
MKADSEILLTSTEVLSFFIEDDILVPRSNTKNDLCSTNTPSYLCSIMALIFNAITKTQVQLSANIILTSDLLG